MNKLTLNPLTPRSDKYLILLTMSPLNHTVNVMRIKEMIINKRNS